MQIHDYSKMPSQEDLFKMPLDRLLSMALSTKLYHRKDKFSLCTISNARSGKCSEDCRFCAQSSRYHTDAPEYGLKSVNELVSEAERAMEAGAERFSIVTSGRGLSHADVNRLAKRIEAIRRRGIKVCASLGIMERGALEELKAAGLSRYHHNLEACREFFPRVCTTHTYEQRVSTINSAKEAGLSVCAGGIIGLGEDRYHRISLALELSALQIDSVPLNILVPIKGTPLHGTPPLPVYEILRTIAVMRLVMPSAAIRIAGGRDSVLKDFQASAFLAGADAMLTGGYLTVRGRPVEEDQRLVKEMKMMWKEYASA